MEEPKSPCDYSDDDTSAKIPPRPAPPSPDRNESPGAYYEVQDSVTHDHDELDAMETFRASIVAAWAAMKRSGKLDTRMFSTPAGDWFLKCTPRKKYSNRSYDIYVTRPRGVGGRYRKVPDLHEAIDGCIADLQKER